MWTCRRRTDKLWWRSGSTAKNGGAVAVGWTEEPGGLITKDNPWSCDCGLVWLGHWLRRWLRETVEIHTLVIKEAQQMEEMAREATCLDQRTNKHIPILDLHPEDLSCQASALSGDGSSTYLLGNHLLGCLIKSISVFGLTQYLWSL
ncbi:hypothetical protein V9T40_001782 [Parthenolecanium corni]|uniref:LRRCT domain-containing protein n=1 Tax=Parthenolecanium corni TaxID=536013 RepID=A0AAN9TH73_9HEMI